MKFPEIRVDKRKVDEGTEIFIKDMLEEEERLKAGKKKGRQSVDTPSTKKTLEQIEDEEGGLIRSSQVGDAITRRSQNRQAQRESRPSGKVVDEDTSMPQSTERFEQDLQIGNDEDAENFMPFNLKREREEGHFDEDGNYVEHKKKKEEEEEEHDAWLDSEAGKVLDEATIARIAARERAAAESSRRGPLTDRQIAVMKQEMAGMLNRRETVTTGLRRLAAAGGQTKKALGKRERQRADQQARPSTSLRHETENGAGQGSGASSSSSAQTASASDGTSSSVRTPREMFLRLTELADELLSEGETDIYSDTKEQLEHAASIWIRILPDARDSGRPGDSSSGSGVHGTVGREVVGGDIGSVASSSSSAAAAGDTGGTADEGDDEDDMFKDDEALPGSVSATKPSGSFSSSSSPPSSSSSSSGNESSAPEGNAGGGEAIKAVAVGTSMSLGQSDDGKRREEGGKENEKEENREQKKLANDDDTQRNSAEKEETEEALTLKKAKEAHEANRAHYMSWPVREIKRLLGEKGVDASAFVEKEEMVTKLLKTLEEEEEKKRSRRNGEGGSGSDGGNVLPTEGAELFTAPPGYAFDPTSGLFFDAEAGLYYHPASTCFCGADGRWFVYAQDPDGSSKIQYV